MLKRILTITLAIMATISIASCQANQTSSPTATPELTLLPTNTPRSELEPTATVISELPSTTPHCFTPIDLTPIAFTPNNSMLVIRGSSGVQIFNLETMKEESLFQAPQNLLSATLSPDGETLAWSLEDNTIQLIQISDGKLLNTLAGHTDSVYKLRFSPTGDKLFSASHDGSVMIWDRNGNELQTLEIGGEVLGIGISPDGTKLATIPFDGPVELWDLVKNKKIAALGGTAGNDTSDAYFSPDGQYLAADLATGLYLWRISDGQLVWNEVKNSLATTFSPDGRFLAYSDVEDGDKVILSSPDGTQSIQSLEGMQGPVWELIFSPNSSLLAATGGPEIRIWQVEDGKLLYIGKATCP